MARLGLLAVSDFARFSHHSKGQHCKFVGSPRRRVSARLLLASLALFVFAISFAPLSTWAQSTSTGTVVGLVTDPTGAIVPEATVSLIDHTTGTTKTTTSNEAGRYIFVNVNPGTYDITVNK